MAYWMYKCNNKKLDHNAYTGDWESVFGEGKPRTWGSTKVVPQLSLLRVDDTVLALQSDKNLLVGVARVSGWRRDRVELTPVQRVSVKVLPLKKRFPEVAAIDALRIGPRKTLYRMNRHEAEALLRAAARTTPHGEGVQRRRVLFTRVGWMTYYDSSTHDEPVYGGGAWDEKHERFNFSVYDGKVFGFFQPSGAGLNLERIDPEATGDAVEDVLVVFVAADPCGDGQRIVGWYEGATVYREEPSMSTRHASRRDSCVYYCSTAVERAVLLPSSERTCAIPHAKTGLGGLGQANLAYTLDQQGVPVRGEWVANALHYISGYLGPNLLRTPWVEVHDQIDEEEHRVCTPSGKQGMVIDAGLRSAIEKHAVKAAMSHFVAKGYQIREVGKPYDLHCQRGSTELFVEVKGSTGPADEVILTFNEVQHALAHPGNSALFILHSIKASGEGTSAKASGGTPHVLSPWALDESGLQPISYWYRVPGT